MIQIQESDIKNIANLARISLKTDEVIKYTKDMQSIVGFIDIVNETEISDELLKQEGFNGFLMGEYFMKQANPAIAFEDFVAKIKTNNNAV